MYSNQYHNQDLSQLSFLVTGGAGFIGSNIVEYLLKYGAKKVRVLDNFSNGYRENLTEFMNNPSFELLEGDIRDFPSNAHVPCCRFSSRYARAGFGSMTRVF